ncbi:hypothetical protein PR048_013705 [Dryococelus australis]|uniref:Uncharacterized protein n=1 Tax=Dryococelus australis TaxID=614101 RepID=A0ABQ9HSX3_9NEOP|nr:hypothetical protein PR048_013705 [Dryococelus australis]
MGTKPTVLRVENLEGCVMLSNKHAKMTSQPAERRVAVKGTNRNKVCRLRVSVQHSKEAFFKLSNWKVLSFAVERRALDEAIKVKSLWSSAFCANSSPDRKYLETMSNSLEVFVYWSYSGLCCQRVAACLSVMAIFATLLGIDAFCSMWFLRTLSPLQDLLNSVLQKRTMVAEHLVRSPPTKVIKVQSLAESNQIFACVTRAGRCRWLAVFLGELTFPQPFIPALLHTHLNHPHPYYRGNIATAFKGLGKPPLSIAYIISQGQEREHLRYETFEFKESLLAVQKRQNMLKCTEVGTNITRTKKHFSREIMHQAALATQRKFARTAAEENVILRKVEVPRKQHDSTPFSYAPMILTDNHGSRLLEGQSGLAPKILKKQAK